MNLTEKYLQKITEITETVKAQQDQINELFSKDFTDENIRITIN